MATTVVLPSTGDTSWAAAMATAFGVVTTAIDATAAAATAAAASQATMPRKFYVSSAGSDSADGLSAATAKRTLGGTASVLPGTGAAEINVMFGALTEAGSVTFSIPITLVGVGGGTNTGLVGSRIIFPAGSSGLIFTNAAQMSEIRSVSIESLSTGAGTDDGVKCARSLKFSQVQIKGFGRYGINGDSSSQNMNFVHGDVRVTGCFGDGIHLDGGDSNQWDLYADISACGGWGWNVPGSLVFGLNARGQVENCTTGAVVDAGYGNMWNVVDCEPINRPIVGASAGAVLPQSTITISDTTGIAPSGLAVITSSSGTQQVVYSSATGGTLSGCTGGVGTMSSGAAVMLFPLVDISAASGAVWWHPSRVSQRDVAVVFSPSQRVYEGDGWAGRLSLIGPGGPLQGQVWSFTNGSAGGGVFTLDNDTQSKRALDVDQNCTRVNMQVGLQVGKHVIGANQTGTTTAAAVSTNATGVSVAGNDTSGTTTLTTAAGIAADTSVATVTFAAAYTAAPKGVMLTPQGGAAAGAQAYVTSITTAAFTVALHVPPAGATAMTFGFSIIQ